MPIQDNLHGALLISAIDFLLSFVLIGGLGVILALFPLINRLKKQQGAPPATLPLERSEPAGSGSAKVPPTTQSAVTATIQPGLSDQQLVVLLTAAAHETLGAPVRIYRVRPLTVKSGNWVAQARHDLQSHRLK
jgi:hypothetical protein